MQRKRVDARGDELTSPYFRAADPTEGQCLLCDQHATRPQLCPEEEGFAGGGGRPVEGLRLDPGQEERRREGRKLFGLTLWPCRSFPTIVIYLCQQMTN